MRRIESLRSALYESFESNFDDVDDDFRVESKLYYIYKQSPHVKDISSIIDL